MTDYDEIRTCCQGKGICVRCWKFISSAVKILDRTLRGGDSVFCGRVHPSYIKTDDCLHSDLLGIAAEDFGFKHLLWVYSGRRGIHCWISDVAALRLTDEQRKGIVGFLEVIKGGAQQHKKVDLHRPLHPTLARCLETLLEPFERIILNDQDCFRRESGWEALLNLLPSSEERLVKMRQDLENAWRHGPELSSRERWIALSNAGRQAVAQEQNTKKVLSEPCTSFFAPFSPSHWMLHAQGRNCLLPSGADLGCPTHFFFWHYQPDRGPQNSASFCRTSSTRRWKTSNSNTCTPASMPKCQSIRTICSNLPS